AVVADVEAAGDFSQIPALTTIVTCPIVSVNGEIITEPGYDSRSGIWYEPELGFVVPDIPLHPSHTELTEAVDSINRELLSDFPFTTPAHRAVAWALLILPFVRPLISGPTPLHFISAPTPGTGKTLLAQVLMAAALGSTDAEPMTVDCEEPEMRK